MHRKKILALLENYHPTAPEEIVYKEMVRKFIDEHPGCFDRSNHLGHITASCLLLNRDENKTLLTHHKKLNRWLQLGGHCDGEFDPLTVAIKEAQEESGVMNVEALSPDIFDIDVHLIPANSKDKSHYHYDIRFLLKIEADETAIEVSDESNDLKWFSRDECPSQDRNVNRMFTKWKDHVDAHGKALHKNHYITSNSNDSSCLH